jgi:hypothetical protein
VAGNLSTGEAIQLIEDFGVEIADGLAKGAKVNVEETTVTAARATFAASLSHPQAFRLSSDLCVFYQNPYRCPN